LTRYRSLILRKRIIIFHSICQEKVQCDARSECTYDLKDELLSSPATPRRGSEAPRAVEGEPVFVHRKLSESAKSSPIKPPVELSVHRAADPRSDVALNQGKAQISGVELPVVDIPPQTGHSDPDRRDRKEKREKKEKKDKKDKKDKKLKKEVCDQIY
jgi:hypothetical protein